MVSTSRGGLCTKDERLLIMLHITKLNLGREMKKKTYDMIGTIDMKIWEFCFWARHWEDTMMRA